jgi:predicted transposase YbfD/YdcC
MSTEEKVSKFIELFAAIPDERQDWKTKHKLVDIIFIAVVCTIANCDDWEDIEWFANLKSDWFKKYLELPNGIPSHDTMERVFSWIDADAFGKCFMEWIGFAIDGKVPKAAKDDDKAKGLMSDDDEVPSVTAVDGKTMRGSRDFSKSALHVINAWCSDNDLILGQTFVSDKSNEMKAIPELIKILDIKGHIVTTDAGGTYKDIAKEIIAKKGDYVLALKGNQPNLFEDVKLFFESELKEQRRNDYNIQSVCKTEKGHGRIEKRTYYMTDRTDWIYKKDEWPGFKSIGMVKSRVERVQSGVITEETRYFISSLPCEPSRFAYAVRRHWGVESMHWSLDTTFNEDKRRSRKDNSAKNLAVLIRLARDIIKAGGVPKRMPLKRCRKQAMVSDAYLEKLISLVFR